jgi:hypothetical protein
MRGPSARLAAACAFAVAMTAFTGSALAGITQGKDTAPPVTPPTPPLVQVTPATQSLPAAPVTKSAGDVVGAQITLTSVRPPLDGVLDGTILPFTGFPTWLAVVIGVALILAGLTLRRRGAATS